MTNSSSLYGVQMSLRRDCGATGGHALVIEDEILIALEIETLLEDLGYNSFDIATSPREAVALAKARRPDLITADIRINEGTGLEAVDAIHAVRGQIPVVFVTGNPDMLQGLIDPIHVDKPISALALRAACLKALG